MRGPALGRAVRVYLVPGDAAPLADALAALGHEVVNDAAAPPPTPGLAQAERQAFLAAVDRMLEADCVVADVSAPRFEAGWCVAWFLAKGRLVVLTCRRDRRAALPPLLAGNPSPWQRLVLYDDPKELPGALRDLLGAAR